MPLTLFEPHWKTISRNEISTGEQLAHSHSESDHVNIVYYTKEIDGETKINHFGTFCHLSPFENRKLGPFTHYPVKKLTQVYEDDHIPAYVSDYHVFTEKSFLDGLLKKQHEEYPLFPAPDEYTYQQTETHNETTYVGIPFRILPIIHTNGNYTSLDMSLYTEPTYQDDQKYTIEETHVSHPAIKPCSTSEAERLTEATDEKNQVKELTIPDQVIDIYSTYPNCKYSSNNITSAPSQTVDISELNLTQMFRNEQDRTQQGLLTIESLNTILPNTDEATNLVYFEPIFENIIYAKFQQQPFNSTLGTKQAINLFTKNDVPLDTQTDDQQNTTDQLTVEITTLNDIERLKNFKKKEIEMTDEKLTVTVELQVTDRFSEFHFNTK
jgi:hypothetical protein